MKYVMLAGDQETKEERKKKSILYSRDGNTSKRVAILCSDDFQKPSRNSQRKCIKVWIVRDGFAFIDELFLPEPIKFCYMIRCGSELFIIIVGGPVNCQKNSPIFDELDDEGERDREVIRRSCRSDHVAEVEGSHSAFADPMRVRSSSVFMEGHGSLSAQCRTRIIMSRSPSSERIDL